MHVPSRNSKNGTGIKRGVILFSVLVIVLPILTIGLLFINYHKRSTYSDINHENMRLASAIRQNVSTFLQAPLRTVSAVAQFSHNPEIVPHLDGLLTQMAESYGFYESIMLLDGKGIVRNIGTRKDVEINRGDVMGLDLSQAPHVIAARNSGKPSWSDTYISPLTGEPTLSLTFPTENGIVVGNFNLSELGRIVAPEHDRPRDRAYLVNAKGRIIAHQNTSKVLQQENVADLPVVKAGLSGQESVFEYEVAGVAMISAAVKIPETGWLVVVERTREEVFAAQRSMESVLALTLVAVALLVLILVLYVNSRVIKPIIAISAATRSVTDGSFTAIAEESSRFSELQELTANFNAMVAAITLRESELQDNNVELEQEIEERGRIEASLQERNEELTSMEEELLTQIDDYVQIHDQLLATEEMLRVNLEAVESSSQKFTAVFENSPIAVALTSQPDGAFTEVNTIFLSMFGYSRGDTIGKTSEELGLWQNEAARKQYIQLLRENKLVNNLEVEMCREGGEEFSVLLSSSQLEIAGMPFALSAAVDITEQKRLQNHLNQSQKMDVVGQLAGGIAHDFNNMLAGIMAAAELLKLRLPDDDKNHKMVDTIFDAATRSAELTRELLTFSRKGTAVSHTFSIHETIGAVINLLERTIDKQIQLVSRLDAENHFVIGDQTQLQNALLNLGVNARDAMPQGGLLSYSTAATTLDESACRSMGISLAPGRYLEITVSDSGVGMTKEILEHIFEPFFTTKGVGKGTGLGLAAVYGAVRNHQGELYVQSAPGVGSVFKMFLPTIEEKTLSKTGSAEVVVGTGGVLLVDDEEILRDVGRELLENLGYRVYLAANGAQSLEVFSAHRKDISLVILDMIMPKMSGREAFQLLRAQSPGLKVLFCSGFSREGTGEELIELGATGFIQKPYNRSELSRAVAAALTS